jgi:hypothetical protein
VVHRRRAFERELAGPLRLVFHVHRKVIGFEQALGLVQDAEKFSRREAMIEIVRDPGLQLAARFVAQGPAAIDEAFVEARDFGDVRVGGNFRAVGKDETEMGVGIGREGRFQLMDLHGAEIMEKSGASNLPAEIIRLPWKSAALLSRSRNQPLLRVELNPVEVHQAAFAGIGEDDEHIAARSL